jgi:fucose 4-O-acetylase-like acetyltransferase
MEKKRIAWMDISKAIGILIVLIVHAEISLGPVTFLGGMFYMPVFFVLAGMTFRYKPEESFLTFVRKKAKRLLVPYFGYNLFLFLFFFLKDSVLTGQISAEAFFPLLGILYSRNCLWKTGSSNVYFMQILNAPTWFLTALFVSLVIFRLLMQISKGDERKLFILNVGVLLAAVVLHYFCPVLLPWSLDCALYAVFFLYFGWLAAKADLVTGLYGKPWALVLLTAAFAGLSVLNGSVNMSVADYGHSMLLYLLVGSLGSLFCMELALFLEKHTRYLSRFGLWLGKHTIPVLCLHLFVYSVAETLLGLLK